MAWHDDCGIDPAIPLPQTATFRESPGGSVFIVLFGLLFTGLAGLMSWGVAREVSWGWALWIPFAMFGLAASLYGARRLAARRVIHVLPDRLDVEDHGLFGATVWSAEYADFGGVLNDIETRTEGSGRTARTYALYTVKLQHPQPDRTVTLFQTLREAGHRARWERTAALLGLPALERVGEGGRLRARNAADLDKPVAALLAEGKLTVDEEALQRVPPGFALKRSGQAARAEWGRPFPWGILLFGAVFAAIPAWIGYFTRQGPLAARIAAPLIGTFFMLLLVMTWLTRSRLTITAAEIVYEEELLGRVLLRKAVRQDRLEDVRIDRLETEQGQGIVLIGDAERVQIGTGLPAPALEWLLAVILAATREARSGWRRGGLALS